MPDQGAPQGARIGYLESIRGLAAVQVLLLHFLAAFAPAFVFALPAATPLVASIHLSPLYFLYDGYSAVYIFFALSGYVLTRSFERNLARPLAQVPARIIRLGLPAIAAVLVSAAAMLIFGKPNIAAGELSGSAWFASQWNTQFSLASVVKDGTLNALFLGYRGLPGVAFLAPWQQAVEQSFVAPLWTLSIEFYGSMTVLLLCWCARRSRILWCAAMLLGAMFTIRSAYICFFVGHLLAAFACAERPAPASRLLPAFSVASGIFVCVLAEVWQPEWLKALCTSPTYLLFPGQFAPMQQKAIGAILVLVGLIHLEAARNLLSKPWLVARSKLSFPLYLIHWPILFGPAAALFLLLDGVIGAGPARLCAIGGGICLAFAASTFFLPLDRLALDSSRALRRRLSGAPEQGPRPSPIGPIMSEMNWTRMVLVAGVALAAWAAWPKRPMVIDSHQPTRQLIISLTLARLDDAIIVLGDSIVEASTLPRSLCGHPIVNAGVGGASTESRLGALLTQALGAKRAAMVVVALGTNDAAIPNSVERYRSNYRALLAEVTALTPRTAILAIPPPEAGLEEAGKVSGAVVDSYNAILPELGREAGAAFIAFPAMPEHHTLDGIHLNAAGYEVWDRAILHGIDAMVCKSA